MILIAIFVVLFATYVLHYFSTKRMRDAVRNIPGPVNFPLMGAMHFYVQINARNIFQKSIEARNKYGKICQAWAFHRLIINSTDHELNDQLLSSQVHIVKQRSYHILGQWLGVGLLLSDGQKWFARRKIITPTFHFKILEEFVEVYDQQSTTLVERLTRKADGKTAFDVYPLICAAALDIIAETAMGTKINAQSDICTPYAAAVNGMAKIMTNRFMKIHLQNELMFTLLSPQLKLRQMKLIRIMHDFTKKVIAERRQTLEKKLKVEKVNNDDMDIGAKKRMALLDVLLQSAIDGKPLSDEDIREEVDTFMFEGHDTTTSAMCFALHVIARHPAVQQRMLEEVLHVFGSDRNRPITIRDLIELKYTECVIKETLRLYPSVPMIAREFQEDFKYTHSVLGDGIIPAGAEFIINISTLMRDPERFENPDDFTPERHENNEKIGAYSLIPFSAGPRNCIGQKFAMLEMKTILAKIIRDFELLPLGDAVQLELNIVLQSWTGYQLGMRHRV